MAHGRQLLLYALVKGLGDAVSRNDKSAADRYRRRLGLIAGEFETNPPVRDALEELLWATERWFAANVVERDEDKEQIVELTGRVMELLSSSAH